MATRFGGHETFAVREGWLSKGLNLIHEKPDAFEGPFVSDDLGVGKNMAKSILHWLTVTGLVRREDRTRRLHVTDVGRTVLLRDPYFLSTGTWWALHINILSRGEDAVVWRVFFNDFPYERFDRTVCTEDLRRRIALEQKRPPGVQTLSRDVSCLLASYATPLPPEDGDPEEGRESPFRLLGLITHFKETGTYRMNRRRGDVPPAILGYALCASLSEKGEGRFKDVGFSEALAKPGGPGKTLCLDIEGLSDTMDKAEEYLGSGLIRVQQLGGKRFIRVKRLSRSGWLKKYYAESGEKRDS